MEVGEYKEFNVGLVNWILKSLDKKFYMKLEEMARFIWDANYKEFIILINHSLCMQKFC